MDRPGLSLIVSFYNKIKDLELVLASLETQSYNNFEVLIADDGSSDEAVEKLSRISDGPLNIRHIRHEDKGWRKNIILNKAVAGSSSDYLVFIDGDCILHPRCLEEHHRSRRKGWITAGRRVNLSGSITGSLTPGKVRKGWLQGRLMFRIAYDSLGQSRTFFENGIYIKSKRIRARINKKDKGVLGSHFSIFKSDLLEVNGFDERFLHPAVGEDTDLEKRLRRNGMRVQTLKHIAIQYHLYHPALPREAANMAIMEENNKGGVTYTPFGIVKDT